MPGGVDESILWVAGFAVTADGVGVSRLGEDGEEVVGGEAAAVVADIDDEAVFVGAMGIDVVLKFFELTPNHFCNVEVSELVVGEFGNGFLSLVEVVRVSESTCLFV